MSGCQARRPERGDKECDGRAVFQVVYRNTKSGKILSTTPGCFKHCLAEVDRALKSGTMARVDMEPYTPPPTEHTETDCPIHDPCDICGLCALSCECEVSP